MTSESLEKKAQEYLTTLCGIKPNRRTGSSGNREATRYFAETIGPFGYRADTTPFDCLDYSAGGASLTCGEQQFTVYQSPYSLPCDVTAPVVPVSTAEELESARCTDRILLLYEEICREQLMPKNFPFYNPEEHKRIYGMLEAERPAAVLTATGRNPELVGALYPYPLINDGDFEIPTAYCTDFVGKKIMQSGTEHFRLTINAERIPETASNVIALKNPGAEKKVVVTAHIDAYEESPGATDNATGTAVLLLLAELLSDYRTPLEIEIAAFNGEDHYSAAGELDYLKRYGSDLERILLVINIDDIGYVEGKSAYSFYECPQKIEQAGREIFTRCPGITEGEPWYNGDHMVFVQKGVPAAAFAAEYMPELMREYTHTSRDTPDIVDCKKIVEVARALEQFIRDLY